MAEKTYAGKDAEIERDQDQAEEAQEGLVERMDEAITRLSWARHRAEGWHISDAANAIGEVLTTLKAIVDKRRQDTTEKAVERKVRDARTNLQGAADALARLIEGRAEAKRNLNTVEAQETAATRAVRDAEHAYIEASVVRT